MANSLFVALDQAVSQVETALELLALALQYEHLDPEQRQVIESQVDRLDSTITELLIVAMEGSK